MVILLFLPKTSLELLIHPIRRFIAKLVPKIHQSPFIAINSPGQQNLKSLLEVDRLLCKVGDDWDQQTYRLRIQNQFSCFLYALGLEGIAIDAFRNVMLHELQPGSALLPTKFP